MPLLASSHPSLGPPQEIQNGRCAPLVSKQLRHRGVPCRSLSARCLLHLMPHGGLLLFPTVAVLEEVLPGRPSCRLVRAPPGSVINGLADIIQVGSDRCLVHSELVGPGSDGRLGVGCIWIRTLSIPEEVIAFSAAPFFNQPRCWFHFASVMPRATWASVVILTSSRGRYSAPDASAPSLAH
jgi:hypothetical protein